MAMSKLSYGSFDSSNTDIAFASTSGYTNPTSELETRKQLSYPLKEIKTFVNNTVSVDGNGNPVQLVVDDGELKYRTEPEGDLTDLDFETQLNTKQDTLVSGTNIKTVGGNSLLGSGNISLFAGIDYSSVLQQISNKADYTETLNYDGWLIIFTQAGGSHQHYINDVLVAGRWGSGGYCVFQPIPVKNGDVYKVTGSVTTATLYGIKY